jgi:hypothetical protein
MDLIMPVHHKTEVFAEHVQSIEHWREESMRLLARRWSRGKWALWEL